MAIRGVGIPYANIRGLYESNWIYGIYTLQYTPQVLQRSDRCIPTRLKVRQYLAQDFEIK